MQNKALQTLLEATAASTETPTELENLGHELAEKLRGGLAQADAFSDAPDAPDVSCTIINNTGCSKS